MGFGIRRSELHHRGIVRRQSQTSLPVIVTNLLRAWFSFEYISYVRSCVPSRVDYPGCCDSTTAIKASTESMNHKRREPKKQAPLSQICPSQPARQIFFNSTKVALTSTYNSNNYSSLSFHQYYSLSRRHGAHFTNRESQQWSTLRRFNCSKR